MISEEIIRVIALAVIGIICAVLYFIGPALILHNYCRKKHNIAEIHFITFVAAWMLLNSIIILIIL